MPHRSSGKKHVRADARKADVNRIVKSSMRTSLAKAHAAVIAHDEDVDAQLRSAISSLDKAVKKGVIKKNTANRQKSRLMRRHNAEVNAAE